MALFKSRKRSAAEPVAAPQQAESIEAMRRRARHRLIGAAVLVLIAVAGFPILFDTQPRPVPVDIPIEIPDRNKVKPLPAPVAAQAPAVVQGKASAPVAAAKPEPREEIISSSPARGETAASTASAQSTPAARPAPGAAAAPVAITESAPRPVAKTEPARAEPKPEARAEHKAEARPEPKPEAKPAARSNDDGSRAKALLDGKNEQAADNGRFIVQVGAFSDPAKARETRLKVERAGMKTYTHVAETQEGKRIRVRVGPFATRSEADKAAHKIKSLELPAAILTL